MKRSVGVGWTRALVPRRAAIVSLVVLAAASSAAASYAAKRPSPKAQLVQAIDRFASVAQGAETDSSTAQQTANQLAPVIQAVCSEIRQGQHPSVATTGDSSGVEQLARKALNRGYARLVQDARRLRPASRAKELVPRLQKSHVYVQRIVTLIEQLGQIFQSIPSDPARCLTLPSVLKGDATGLLKNGNLLSQDVDAMRQILSGVSPKRAIPSKKTVTVPG